MWELDHKEIWVPKNWYFWTVLLEKTLKSPLDCRETKPVNPKGNQPWIIIGRTDAETEALILCSPDEKSRLIGKERPWCWERLKAGGERDSRGWDGWMAPLTQWTWIWASSGRQWRTEKPDMVQSMGSRRVGHDWTTSLSLFTLMHWRKWQPSPVFLPGESQGWGSSVGCCLWGHTESDTTEAT